MKKRIFSLFLGACLVLLVLLSTASCTKTSKMNDAILALNGCNKLDLSLYSLTTVHVGSQDEEYMQKQEFTRDGKSQELFTTFNSYSQTVLANSGEKSAKDGIKNEAIDYDDYLTSPDYLGYINGLLKAVPAYCLKEARFDSVGKKQTMSVNLTGEDFAFAYSELDKIFASKLVSLEGEEKPIEYNGCELKIVTRQGYLAEIYLKVNAECGFTSAEFKFNLVCNSYS